jgi:hypothetical protein
VNLFARRQTRTILAPLPPPLPPEPAIPNPPPDMLENFRAVMMATLLEFRGKRDGANVFALYAAAVDAEVERFRRKGLDDGTMAKIKDVADRAINRARLHGLVAFEPGN